jgi:hypothetical protein
MTGWWRRLRVTLYTKHSAKSKIIEEIIGQLLRGRSPTVQTQWAGGDVGNVYTIFSSYRQLHYMLCFVNLFILLLAIVSRYFCIGTEECNSLTWRVYVYPLSRILIVPRQDLLPTLLYQHSYDDILVGVVRFLEAYKMQLILKSKVSAVQST